jgi:hypothetical protein
LPPRRFDTNATDLLLRLGTYLHNNHCEHWFPRHNLNSCTLFARSGAMLMMALIYLEFSERPIITASRRKSADHF